MNTSPVDYIWKNIYFAGQVHSSYLPSKITVPENTKTGVVVFSLEPRNYALRNAYPEITTNAFSYNEESKSVHFPLKCNLIIYVIV